MVLRVTFPREPERLQQPLRLRGVTFERFAGNGWLRSDEPPRPLRGNTGLVPLPRTNPPDPEYERSYRAELYLEPLDRKHPVLFTPPQTHAVELLDTQFDALRGKPKQVWRTSAGDLTYQAPPATSLHYAVEVVEPLQPAKAQAQLREASGTPPDELLARYTQLPDNLDPRIGALARQLAGAAEGWYDRARAIEAGLRTGWTYSLAGDQDAAQPLQDFLFGKKRGHCEYFATAMALMLRTQGIPARTVHGFAGGIYNPIGRYRMIRQGDAHAWVEVYLPGVGWRTFDPTPPSGQVAPADDGIGLRLRQLADGVNLLWYQWVVEYNLDRQVELIRGMVEVLRGLRSSPTRGVLDGAAAGPAATTAGGAVLPPWAGWLALPVAAVAAGLWWWRKRRARSTRGFDAAIDRAVQRLQAGLGQRGWQRRPAETWLAVAARLPAEADALRPRLQSLAHAYDRARYAAAGPAACRDEVLTAVSAALVALRALPRRARAQSLIAEPTPSGSVSPLKSSAKRRSS